MRPPEVTCKPLRPPVTPSLRNFCHFVILFIFIIFVSFVIFVFRLKLTATQRLEPELAGAGTAHNIYAKIGRS